MKPKFLIVGDALMAEEGQLVGPIKATTPNFEEAVESIGKLCTYDVEQIICYHGGVVKENAQQALKDIYEDLKSNSL